MSFKDLSIRKFGYSGRFDVEHGPEDMAFVDWTAGRNAGNTEAVFGKPVELVLKKETVELLKRWQAVYGTPLSILIRQALEAGDAGCASS